MIVLGGALAASQAFSAPSADPGAAPWVADLGDGRYRNPVLPGDWSDPDIVRVGEDYYLTASSFANVPGLPILHSKDLVNWTIIGHALKRNNPDATFSTPRRGGGVWAPAIRHHDGKFMIYYPDPDHGIFVVTASDPAGPWTEPVLVDNSKGAIDPAPFWDDDGTGWLVMAWAASRAGFNNIVTLKPLNADGTKTVGEGTTIIDGKTLGTVKTSRGVLKWTVIEGPKLYKRGGWYYIFAPSGGVKPGWQGVFRSRNLKGPYEGRNVLDQGPTAVNGPHQGGYVETPAGESWFMHFQDTDSYGRRVHLEPMTWKNGWPLIGVDPDGDGIGQPVETYRKPKTGETQPIAWPQTDDSFDGPLSLGWQWNANPREDWMSLTAHPGHLRLRSVSVPANMYESGAQLTQKLPGPSFTATTKMTFSPVRVGEQAGLVMFGYDYAWVGLRNTADGVKIVQRTAAKAELGGQEQELASLPAPVGPVYLRLTATPTTKQVPPPEQPMWPSMSREVNALVNFSYSTDGVAFTPIGQPFTSRVSRWVGAQMGLFAASPTGSPAFVATTVGYADFDSFEVTK